MFKIVKADKDTYITNKAVKGKRKTDSNVGSAGTLDLFKLHNVTQLNGQPIDELSRILIHFNIDDLKKLYSSGRINIDDPSFWCKIHLKDVYGGQPTPENFTVSIFPLSSSFSEGIGKDVSYYSDYGASNWLSSSIGTQWYVTGCGSSCTNITQGDYIVSSTNLINTEVSYLFKKGDEDLIVDVTKIISATLVGEIPDAGFRLSFSGTIEEDNKSYFVKRFASSNAYDPSKRPKFFMGYDDSLVDDSQNLEFDTPCSIFLYNYSKGDLSNILSGSSLEPIVGQNCISLKLVAEIPSGSYELLYSGSQLKFGSYVNGVYKSNVLVSSYDPSISSIIASSGSIKFIPIWQSLDGSVAYSTGNTVTFNKQQRGSSSNIKNYTVTALDIKETYQSDSEPTVRINIFDRTDPYIVLKKLPYQIPGKVLPRVFYQIRDVQTNEAVIPFDFEKNSTKLSADSNGMFFKFMTSNLEPGSTYSVDIMIDQNDKREIFKDVSPVFKVESPKVVEV